MNEIMADNRLTFNLQVLFGKHHTILNFNKKKRQSTSKVTKPLLTHLIFCLEKRI